MRVITAFKRLLRLPGASVIDVSFTADGVIVTVRLRRRRRVCAECGQTGRAGDPRPPRQALAPPRSRPALAAGSSASCGCCGAATAACGLEAVPWARPGAGAHARLRGHGRVAGAADGVRADHPAAAGSAGARSARSWSASSLITSTSAGSEGLVAIGVDEISYRRHHRYLTTVADHRHGRDRVVPARPQQRHPAGLLRRARRRKDVDPGGLDRHERRVPTGDPRRRPAGRDLL